MQQPEVLVVGAGFAGFECARRLARSGVNVTVVDPEDYFLYTPLLPDVAGGLVEARHAAVPLAESLPAVKVIRGMVTAVDLDRRTATVAVSGRQEAPITKTWDRLVLTVGSVTRLFDIPGLRRHALGLKTLAEALYLRDHLLGQLEMSVAVADDRQACSACRTVVVVGASYAGTELVAQLRGLADQAARHHRFDPAQVRFLLLDVADAVMPEVGAELGGRALDVLRGRGVDVRLGTTLESVDEHSVRVSDGSVVDTNTVAWVTGVTASPLAEALGVPLVKGRLAVDDLLRVDGRDEVFAGGDGAAVPDLTRPGEITPPTAQHALRQGRTLAANVAASLGHGRPRRYRHRNLGLVVDLGPGFAVANPLGLELSGMAAKAVTRAYHLAAVPKRSNRFGIALDYLSGLMAPRPLVSMGLVDPGRARFDQAEHLG